MKIIFEEDAFEKIKALVTNCETEIMGLGKIEILSPHELLVEDIVVIKQEATCVHTEFDKDELMKFYESRIKEKDSQHWKLWWHSHADMSCYWSTTDTDNIERLGETADWVASVVFNHKMEYLAQVNTFKPLALEEPEVPVTQQIIVNEKIIDWAKEEIEQKVEKPKPEIKGNVTTIQQNLGDEDDNDSMMKKVWEIETLMESFQKLAKWQRRYVSNNPELFDKTQVIEYYQVMKGIEDNE